MKLKRLVAVSTALAAVVAGGVVASAANAEVVSNSYVLVGSDTLQDASNALANGTRVTGSLVRVKANNETIGSFDAFPSSGVGSQIQTKPGGARFLRPSGSGNGVNALIASINTSGSAKWNNVDITGQVDIARSSSAPKSADVDATNGKLAYIPFGRDAVSYIYTGGTAAWANLSAAELKQIFEGTLTTVDGVAITPRLPQSGSGTRSFFLSAIGVTTPAASIDVNNTTAENDASVLGANQIIPFSVASWTAQSTGSAPTTLNGTSVVLGTPISGVAPVTGAGTAMVPNSAFYSTAFGRDTYLVVERARITPSNPKYDAGLAALVDPTKAASLTNSTASAASTPAAVKKKFGFLAPSTTAPTYAYPAA